MTDNQQKTLPQQSLATKPRKLTENVFNEKRANTNIELLRQFKQGNLDIVKQYTGFGGLRRAFKDNAIQASLSEFLTADEIEGLRKSASTGYFTPALLIDFIYDLVQKLGFEHGKILEPACGHGAFFERMPKLMRQNSEVMGIEFEPLCAGIAKSLYPDIDIRNQGFQYFQDSGFDLIIGNPPFANFSIFDKKHTDLNEEMIHHYFVAKSVRLLKEGGLLAMVVPNYVLDNPKRHLREQIAEYANLVAAYRMPHTLFDDAKVTVDVVVFQRKANPSKHWQGVAKKGLIDKTQIYMAEYFIQHPDHILGELDTYEAHSYFDDRPRRGLRCNASVDDVQQRLPQLINEQQPLNV